MLHFFRGVGAIQQPVRGEAGERAHFDRLSTVCPRVLGSSRVRPSSGLGQHSSEASWVLFENRPALYFF